MLGYLIGSGGMANVHLGYDRAQYRTVAIKMLQDELAGDPAAKERMRREAEALASIRSPHVVTLHDIVIDQGAPCLVLQRIHGLTLEQEIARFGIISATRACRIALDILAGLTAIHSRGFVHRDLKPSNVIVDLDDRAVLLDLGIALHRRKRPLTPPGFAAGTPAYMAPEQHDRDVVDGRVDLYQLGILLIHMSTGVEVDRESGRGYEALFRMPPPLADVALHAIAPVGARYPSTAEMVSAIRTALCALDRSWGSV